MSNVFCGNCKHFLCWNYGEGLCISVGEECNHPNNVKYDTITNAECSYKKKIYIESYAILNKGNDCPWYKYTIFPTDAFAKDMFWCFTFVFGLVSLIFGIPYLLGKL